MFASVGFSHGVHGQEALSYEQESVRRLQSLERQTLAIKLDIEGLEQRIVDANRQLEALREQGDAMREDLLAEESRLATLLRQLYLAGPVNRVRLWLRPGHLHAKDRLMEYHRLIRDARYAAIARYRSKLEERDELSDHLTRSVSELEKLHLAQTRKEEGLARATGQIQETIARFRHRRTLLYRSLAERDTTARVASGAPFEQMRGMLQVPLNGDVEDRFGKKYLGGLVWHGWEITSDAQQAVRAVHDGTVMFARYNKLMGHLIVIDHGERYLSLYARNQRVLKTAGDIVSGGEAIATIGKAGVLYFGLLRGDVPIDPKLWLMP